MLPFFYERSKMTVLDIFARLVALTIDVALFAMLLRVILSFFSDAEDSRISIFLALITEPFIAPVRFLMVKFNLLQNSPIDWSFTLTYMIMAFMRVMLPAL